MIDWGKGLAEMVSTLDKPESLADAAYRGRTLAPIKPCAHADGSYYNEQGFGPLCCSGCGTLVFPAPEHKPGRAYEGRHLRAPGPRRVPSTLRLSWWFAPMPWLSYVFVWFMLIMVLIGLNGTYLTGLTDETRVAIVSSWHAVLAVLGMILVRSIRDILAEWPGDSDS